MSKNNLSKVTKRGYPLPLGVTVLNEGINFSLFPDTPLKLRS